MAVIKRLIVFGDSNTDIGNTNKLTSGQTPGKYSFQGRYSNGPVFTDVLAETYNLEYTNYSYGGATINNENMFKTHLGTGIVPPTTVPGIKQQIEEYVASLNNKQNEAGKADRTLYVIMAGANDFLYEVIPKWLQVINRLSLGDMSAEIVKLAQLLVDSVGAKNLLVLGVRAAEDAPILRKTLQAGQLEVIRSKTVEFNIALEQSFLQYRKANLLNSTPVKIVYYDIYSFSKAMWLDPVEHEIDTRLGLTSMDLQKDIEKRKADSGAERAEENACLGYIPDNLMFWDGFHLAKKPHRMVASNLVKLLSINRIHLELPGYTKSSL